MLLDLVSGRRDLAVRGILKNKYEYIYDNDVNTSYYNVDVKIEADYKTMIYNSIQFDDMYYPEKSLLGISAKVLENPDKVFTGMSDKLINGVMGFSVVAGMCKLFSHNFTFVNKRSCWQQLK